MGVLRPLSIALLGLLLLLPIETAAQGLTGTLVGIVKDAEGGVVPRAVVRVSSPALLGGERQTTSSDRGEWRFQILPFGTPRLFIDPRRAMLGVRVNLGR